MHYFVDMYIMDWIEKRKETLKAVEGKNNPYGRKEGKPSPKTFRLPIEEKEDKETETQEKHNAGVRIEMAKHFNDDWVNKMNTDKDGKIYSFVENKDKWSKEMASLFLTKMLDNCSNSLMSKQEKEQYLTDLEKCFEKPGVNKDEILKAAERGDMNAIKKLLEEDPQNDCITNLIDKVGTITQKNARQKVYKISQINKSNRRGGKKKSKKAKKTNKKTNTKKRHNKKSRTHKKHKVHKRQKLHKKYKTRRQR
jgi:hypothetical protein